jgi:hypothetical protein
MAKWLNGDKVLHLTLWKSNVFVFFGGIDPKPCKTKKHRLEFPTTNVGTCGDRFYPQKCSLRGAVPWMVLRWTLRRLGVPANEHQPARAAERGTICTCKQTTVTANGSLKKSDFSQFYFKTTLVPSEMSKIHPNTWFRRNQHWTYETHNSNPIIPPSENNSQLSNIQNHCWFGWRLSRIIYQIDIYI